MSSCPKATKQFQAQIKGGYSSIGTFIYRDLG